MRVPLAMCVVLCLAVIMPAQAQEPGQEDPCAGAFRVTLQTDGAFAMDWTFAFNDVDSDGALGSEAVYIVDADLASTGGIRIANHGALGSMVLQGDADAGRTLSALAGVAAYYDANGNGAFDLGDTLLWDLGADGAASPEDLVLSGPDAGAPLGTGDPLVNSGLVSLDPSIGVWDADASGDRNDGDVHILDLRGGAPYGRVGQVVLSGRDFGHAVDASDDLAMAVLDEPLDWTLYFVDDDVDEMFDYNEPLYAGASGRDAVEGLWSRLANTGSYALGSQVRASASDYANPVDPMPGHLAFAGGDARGMVVWDTDADGLISVLDVLLSGRDAGHVVDAGSDHLQAPLTTFSSNRLAAWDTDGNGFYSLGDMVWLDIDGNGRVSVYDIALFPQLFGAQLMPDVTGIEQHNGEAGAYSDGCAGDGYTPPVDTDGDGVMDHYDNCPGVANAWQADVDNDGTGDACDDDNDNDGVDDVDDNCPGEPNPGQADADGDGIGDACDDDNDNDNDGVGDADDNCPGEPNPGQADADGDGIGDACDGDIDGDGVTNAADRYPNDPQRASGDDLDGDGTDDEFDADDDGDGRDDEVDNCPMQSNAEQNDTDGDNVGDVCDDDMDGDGVPNTDDAFPLDAARASGDDADGDGIDDEFDDDDDGDGAEDTVDNCILVSNPAQADTDGDGVGDACSDDDDGDGIEDADDNCALASNASQEDADGDGVGDACDGDADGDGIDDTEDNCPTANAGQADTDGDGIGDACDPDAEEVQDAGGADRIGTPGPGFVVVGLLAFTAAAMRRRRD